MSSMLLVVQERRGRGHAEAAAPWVLVTFTLLDLANFMLGTPSEVNLLQEKPAFRCKQQLRL